MGPPTSCQFLLPKGTLISFRGTLLECSVGGILGGGVCPSATEADELWRFFCSILSLPPQPCQRVSSANWAPSPGSWTLGWAQRWKNSLEYIHSWGSTSEPLSRRPCCQQHLQVLPDPSDPPLPSWLLGFPCGPGGPHVLPIISLSSWLAKIHFCCL